MDTLVKEYGFEFIDNYNLLELTEKFYQFQNNKMAQNFYQDLHYYNNAKDKTDLIKPEKPNFWYRDDQKHLEYFDPFLALIFKSKDN